MLVSLGLKKYNIEVALILSDKIHDMHFYHMIHVNQSHYLVHLKTRLCALKESYFRKKQSFSKLSW